ncbi:hypothetical protein PV08_06598 [Exophiala spinifera]|uniref:Uncharacterized protein n=1 Tax=Exophiala spinifera TaxID=91928 RepID=A0A0D2B4D3_9EURO|nr:uncharacterized protein PV08_06598 [Exophiala spinifera]KIW13818.1 hypothetical protein PV08_06598 [Exophiala spinifera]
MPSTCKTKVALLKGLRPRFADQQQVATTQRILSSACSSSCIYCDIWKLAALIASHVPLRARYNLPCTSLTSSPITSRPSSPVSFSPTLSATSPNASLASMARKIEAQFQAQRSHLNSILSICTVAGADECEGLQIAHHRCSATVEDLLDQEEVVEEALLEDLQQQELIYLDYNQSFASKYSSPLLRVYAYPQPRRPSAVSVGVAI